MKTLLLRRAATGTLLGLPAALLAHMLTFGQNHAAGGRLHALFLDLAFSFVCFAAIAIAVRASRHARHMPANLLWVAMPALAWFCGIEAVEAHHGIPQALSFIAILAASWLVRGVVRAFAHTVVAVIASLWTRVRECQLRVHCARLQTWLPALRPAYRFRIFSRPPPRFLNA